MSDTTTGTRVLEASIVTPPSAEPGRSLGDQLRRLLRSVIQQGHTTADIAYVAYRSTCLPENVERFLNGKGLNMQTVERLLSGLKVQAALSPAESQGCFRAPDVADDAATSLTARLRKLLLLLADGGHTVADLAYVAYHTASQGKAVKRFLYAGGGINLSAAERIISGLGLKVSLVRQQLDAQEQLPAVLWREDVSDTSPANVTPAGCPNSITPEAQQQ
jgi:hypothetical protein